MADKYPTDVSKSRHILKLKAEEKRAWINTFDFVLFDCDGCIWNLVEPIPNTGPAINLLRCFGKCCKFVSNNSMRTDRDYQKKLAAIGVENVNANDLIHPVKTISRYINDYFPNQPVFSLCSPVMNDVFRKNGVNIKFLEPDVEVELDNICQKVLPNDNVEIAAVVLDINFNLTFNQLARAAWHLQNSKNSQFLVGASDVLIPVSKDFVTIGNAGFLHTIKQCSGKTPIVLGKPSALLGKYLMEHLNLDLDSTKRVLFVGDNLQMDVAFGIESGFQTLFVLTGISTYQEMLQKPHKEQPDFYADSVADFIQFLESLTK